ncbi:hypothetical protein HPB47_009481 [Ixodes persulcatus]|uniref:Uncharacterized protein n=1 Tax=Ixodes persulcatus TaxID=34615 RepID=A0AC60P212_IXOPE|nr:hypothetical protein HPB47_009481 [Ixodes persulcatus]
MAPLARTLSTIPYLHSLFYADDITLWCTHGPPVEMESTLQTGLYLVAHFFSLTGLQAIEIGAASPLPLPEQAGHWFLHQAGKRPIDSPLQTPQKPFPDNPRCAPLPAHMTPCLHAGRRQTRALHQDPFPLDTIILYVNGATACVIVTRPATPPITSTAGPLSSPTTPLALEYRICTDSMEAIWAIHVCRLPEDLRDDLSSALFTTSPCLCRGGVDAKPHRDCW